ncbi:recombinase family protein [Amycolatopsis plumensis]|uniref:Recombinase family protein n=2 Tax=Amycolatopsis plumensis TaxID=236508 RepID=A0ABV5UJQ6_9PSEU
MTSLARLEKSLRVRLYLRISDLTDTSTSIARQEKAGHTKADALGATEVVVSKDEDKSGYDPNVSRPGFDEALEDMRTGRADVLIVYKVDRATRQGIAAASEIIKIVYSTGCRFISITDGIDSVNEGWEIQLVIAAQQAHKESKNTSIRVADLRAFERDAGRWMGSRPTGHRITPERKLTPHPCEAPMLRKACAQLLKGKTGTEVIQWLNRQGYDAPMWANRKERILTLEAKGEPLKAQKLREKPLKSVNSWKWNTLRQIILSPTIVGLMPHDGQIYRHSETGEPIRVGEEILKLEDWVRLCEMFGPDPEHKKRRAATPSNKSHETSRVATWLLKDYVACGECDSRIIFDTVRAHGSLRPRYRCQTGQNTFGGKCPGCTMQGPALEQMVVDAMFTRLAALDYESPAVMAIAERWADRKHPDRVARRARLLSAIADEENFLDRLEEEKLNGLFQGSRGEQRFKRRYEGSTARLAQLESELAAIPEKSALDVGFINVLDELEAGWESSDLAAKRELLGLLVERVWIGKAPGRGRRPTLDRLTFWWVGEPEPHHPRQPKSITEAAAVAQRKNAA